MGPASRGTPEVEIHVGFATRSKGPLARGAFGVDAEMAATRTLKGVRAGLTGLISAATVG